MTSGGGTGWDAAFGDGCCGGPAPARLELPAALADEIRAAARAAWPQEGCGLLVGQGGRVDEVVPSANVAACGRDRFEVDPRVRLALMKRLRGTPRRMVGHWHSHPDHPPVPSPTDLACAHERGLVWLICGVTGDGATELAAWRLAAGGEGFEPVALVVPKEDAGV